MGFLLVLCGACSEDIQRNEIPALAALEGGTGGGPIEGTLRVVVFDRSSRTPAPGVTVMLGNRETASTNGEGVATFKNVSGPQDVHVFACRGCRAVQENTAPFLYQNTSLYQVNAANIAIPIAGRNPAQSDGALAGKIFGTRENDRVYVLAMDDRGGFSLLPPLRTSTQRLIRKEEQSTGDVPLTFVHTKNLDDWAALRPELGRQAFGQVALLGKVVDENGKPKGGVQVIGRYFDGQDAGKPLYFNTAGLPDPTLSASANDGRFVFLHLAPDFDMMIEAENLGVGIGTRPVRLPSEGTLSITLPVLPLLQNTLSLSGRVVSYHLNYREEEQKNGTSGINVALNGAQIVFPGDALSLFTTAGIGPIIAGNYQVQNHLLKNGDYLPRVFGGNTFRPTVQSILTGARSRMLNYPLAVVPQAQLVGILRAGTENNDLDLTSSNGELVGRVVHATGVLDPNGDPLLAPLANVTLSILAEDGSPLPNLYYLDSGGFIDTRLQKTTSSGGFVYFSLVGTPKATDKITIVATDNHGDTLGNGASTRLLRRQLISLAASSVRLLDLVVEPNAPPPPKKALGAVVDTTGFPIDGISATLFGGLPADAETDCPGNTLPVLGGERFGDHDDLPSIAPNCRLSGLGDYLVRIERPTGGGEYRIAFDSAARRIGLVSFQVAPSGQLSGIASVPSIDTRNTFGLQNDLDMRSASGAGIGPSGPRGQFLLPPQFKLSDITTLFLGSASDSGRSVIGADTRILSGSPTNPYQLPRPALDPAAQSYFILASARNTAGEESKTLIQGLSQIPAIQDVRIVPPPRLSQPASGALGVGLRPHLSWNPPEGETVDFYWIQLRSAQGDRLWEAFVPGDILAIDLPEIPETGEKQLEAFKSGSSVRWTVRAMRAGGMSLHHFNFKQLADRLEGESAASSLFTP